MSLSSNFAAEMDLLRGIRAASGKTTKPKTVSPKKKSAEMDDEEDIEDDKVRKILDAEDEIEDEEEVDEDELARLQAKWQNAVAIETRLCGGSAIKGTHAAGRKYPKLRAKYVHAFNAVAAKNRNMPRGRKTSRRRR